MAHVKVARRSMSLEQWSYLMFEQVDALIVTKRMPISGWTVRTGTYHPEGYEWDAPQKPIAEGELWGRPDGTSEFCASLTMPADLAGQAVYLSMRCAGEVMVWLNGRLLDGIDPNRQRALLVNDAKAGQLLTVRLEAYSRSKPDDERNIQTRALRGCVQPFHTPALEWLDPQAFRISRQFTVLHAAAFGDAFSEDAKDWLQARIREAIRLMPPFECPQETLRAALPALEDWLTSTTFAGRHSFGHKGRLACVAHSHLDIAYHWRVRQSVQKNARTCLIQLRLMDRHPDFLYTHSQAWTYEMLEQFYPTLFDAVKQRIAEGRWEVVGGLYVEPDCNLICAESLCRQIILGKRYFLEKFGLEIDNCWLPDVFGNSAIMPQILQAGGIRYFVSNKMSTWNDTNRFPHHHFRWRGIDGSEVMACVPPTHFITWHDPNQWIENWDQFIDKDCSDESLQMYGFGDGGSGVTEEMLEDFKWVQQLPEVPEARVVPAKDFLNETFRETKGLALWDGELYLEMHRGTFTTKAALKKENRQAELLSYETELLCAMAALQGADYPADALTKAWKRILVNQFHDILPGSHTHPVFGDAMNDYAATRTELCALRDSAWSNLTVEQPNAFAVFNPFHFERHSVATIDGNIPNLKDEAGRILPVQTIKRVNGATQQIFEPGAMPGFSARNFTAINECGPEIASDFEATPSLLENRWFRLEFTDDGSLTRLYDRVRDHEVLANESSGNQWQLFEDRPGNYNAWDLLDRFEDHPIDIGGWDQIEVADKGPISAALRMTRCFENSRAEQIVRIYRTIPRIDFDTWVDWQEEERLLKVAFPLNMRVQEFHTDTSAGALSRPVHRNTSWEQARFEVCCHQWARVGEGRFGFSILNNGKYGCDLKDSTLRLSLLRAPIRPDRTSDRGEHRFQYSLYFDAGSWADAALTEAALELNAPLPARRGNWKTAGRFIAIDAIALHVQSVKLADDGSGDLIMRLMERCGSRGTATITTAFPWSEATPCDLLERPLSKPPLNPNAPTLSFRAFELITLRFKHSHHASAKCTA